MRQHQRTKHRSVRDVRLGRAPLQPGANSGS
jgi:hypothetical protein